MSHHSPVPIRCLRHGLCLLLLTTGFGLAVSGCGYQPAGSVGRPGSLHRLHLATLANATYRPGVQGIVGAAILRQLQRDGRVRLAAETNADAILGGSLTSYLNEPIAFERADIGRRFRVRLALLFTLTGRSDARVLVKEEIVGEAFYTAGPGVVATRAAEEEAIVRAAQDLADRVVARILEDW